MVDHQVAGDRHEPGRDVLARPGEGVQSAQGPHERLGGQVLGQVVRPAADVDVAVDDIDVRLVDLPEGLRVAGLSQVDQGLDPG